MFKLEIIAFMIFIVLFLGGFGVIRFTKRKTKQGKAEARESLLPRERAHLTPDDHPLWVEDNQVKIWAQQLVRSGFTRYNAFKTGDIASLNVLFFYHPKTGIIVEITSHRKHGLSVSLTTRYKNGDMLTVTNSLRLCAWERRSGWELICHPRADLKQLVAAFKNAIKPGVRLSVEDLNIERLWEKTYLNNGQAQGDLQEPAPRAESPVAESPAYQSQPVETEPLTIGNLSTLVAKVVLDRPALPSIKILKKQIKSHFRKRLKPTRFKLKNGVMVFNLPGGSGAITLLPHPIPEPDMAAAVRDSVHWPEAAQTVEDHGAHLIVTVNLSKHSLVERHLILTRLTSAVARACEAKGVYWCHSGLLFHPAAFEDLCRKAGKDQQPLAIWVNFRISENGHQGLNLQSRGLAAFNLMEMEMVECEQPSEEMVSFATVMTRYLIDNGPVIRSGDTFGPNQKTKIEVVHQPSLADSSQTVYRIMF